LSPTLEVVVFTDGAAKGNPGPGGWGAVIRVARAAVRELGGCGGHTTNNRMEMTAALEALAWLRGSRNHEPLDIAIVTDSTYLIRGVTQWMASWRRRGWKTAEGLDVANRDLWEALAAAIADVKSEGRKLGWHHVRGHRGIPGNERADAIATGFAAGTAVALYNGPYSSYGIDLDSTAVRQASTPASRRVSAASGKSPRTSRTPPANSGSVSTNAGVTYLSVVDGVPARHSTWPECEQRVKGCSGARFKKAKTNADQEAILAKWGFSMKDLASSAS